MTKVSTAVDRVVRGSSDGGLRLLAFRMVDVHATSGSDDLLGKLVFVLL